MELVRYKKMKEGEVVCEFETLWPEKVCKKVFELENLKTSVCDLAVEENLRTADLILAGKDDHVPFDYDGFHAFFAHKTDPSTGKRADGISGNIVYAENKIR